MSDLTEIRTALSELKDTLDSIDVVLRGDGKNIIGHTGRLDRLEQSEKKRTKYLALAVGSALTALGSGLWSLFTGKPS